MDRNAALSDFPGFLGAQVPPINLQTFVAGKRREVRDEPAKTR
jgi:hypothetical protein